MLSDFETPKGLNTVNEAAMRWKVKPSTVRSWMAQRKVAFVRLGRCMRIRDSEIERIVTEGSVPARERAGR
jgi:excisionase family DNA binding protein